MWSSSDKKFAINCKSQFWIMAARRVRPMTHSGAHARSGRKISVYKPRNGRENSQARPTARLGMGFPIEKPVEISLHGSQHE
jgi:hypothetical protein